MFGTFCLVFAGTGSIIVNQLSRDSIGVVGVGLVFGLIVMAMIYSVGHISGAHLNPAVTLGFLAAGRHRKAEVLPYILSQIAGASIASLTLKAIFLQQPTTLGLTLPAGSVWQSLAMECVMTAILMTVILQVATGDREEGLMAGVAIGGTIALEAIFGGPVSGASMNPARSFGPAIATYTVTGQWIYWLGPVIGSFVGVLIHKTIHRAARSN